MLLLASAGALLCLTIPLQAPPPAGSARADAPVTALQAGAAEPQNSESPTAQPAPPPKKPRPSFYMGPDVGIYLPTNSHTRSRFGSSWFGVGASIGAVGGARPKGRFGLDLQLESSSRGSDYALLALAGVEYRRSLLPRSKFRQNSEGASGDKAGASRRTPRVNPYAGVSADIAPGYLRAVEDGVHSGVGVGLGGSAFVGVSIGRRVYVQARYIAVSSIKGFDLSGADISAGYRFRF